jgi:gliding motility-associated-like protein
MKKQLHFFLFLLGMFFSALSFAQVTTCPEVIAGPDTALCGNAGCVNLYANITGTRNTNTYAVGSIPYNPYSYTGSNQILINIDDVWSSAIQLPFCFNFFGQTYNSIVIGSNAIISFDVSQANQYCQWPIANAIPSGNADPMNSIMAPWHDIDPSVGNSSTDISWQIYGTAPCREMVISWDSVPMFQCNNLIASSQLVLHETTNTIDVFMENKPICSSWNSGAAILGIQDATGTTAYVATTYNFPTQWSAVNEGWRFTPSGSPQYAFSWFDILGNPLSQSTNFQVCPTTTTSYVAVVSDTTCNGVLVYSDTVTVTVQGTSLTTATSNTPDICNGNVGTATATPSGQGPFTYLWSPGGQTTQTVTGLPAGSYTVIIHDANGCAISDTVIVPNTNPSINPIITTNATGGIINQTAPNTPVQICFSNTSPGSINSWSWVYNGTQNSNLQAPCFTETDSGYFCATLTVTDTNGCVDTAIACVRVQSEAVFSFPNVFTPNADGSNDLFLATTVGVKDLKCTVYDRWGNEIYTWDGAANGWNGKTMKGKLCTDGVYYWEATVTDYQEKAQNVSGFVELIR